ncbi:MAG: class I SAM-dependent methyltransferase [Betaproteobacteria bacterium]
MLIALADLAPLLRSPRTGAPVRLVVDAAGVPESRTTSEDGSPETYPVIDGIPVLVDFERSVLDREQTLASRASSRVTRRTSPAWMLARRFVQGRPVVARAKCADLIRRLLADAAAGPDSAAQPLVVVVGGGNVGAGAEPLYAESRVAVAGFDIYASPQVQFIADAHDIPLANGCADAVWIQTVLEHVIDPARVVAEIARILRPDGYVYAETPLMQQVHEGAFDFTRFTQAGQRWLFRAFDTLDEGVVEGAGVALRWSVRYFVAGLTRSRTAGAIAGAALFWLRFFDRVADPRHASDGACSLFYFGRKGTRALRPSEVIGAYAGAQR